MNFTHVRRLTAATAIVGLFALASVAQARVLARVNGAEITDQDLTIANDDVGGNLPAQLKGAARDSYLLDFLIDGKLVAQKAEAEKIADTEEFKRKLAFYREKLLMETYLGKLAKDATTDSAVQKAYDDVKAKQKPETEVHARHILVPTEAEAKKAIERIKAGEDFAKVATEMSKDPGSKGGDLGWFTKERMVPEFADAAFKLEPGQISAPVKTQFGWHVIKVEEKRQKEFPKLDEVRDQVVRYVGQKAQTDAVIKLRESAKIERTADAPVDPAKAAPAGDGKTAPAPQNAPAKK
ncbi:MAG: peptidylprolyl isomerase [Hyphomicrobiales bacterium]|nr:peptidylprolyl isomerase [Hyphomicrobiales bacterium]